MERHLHIVSLNVPYPPDYGGVFDLFYKLKYLYEAGIKIHLHCFEYGRGEQTELNKYCEEVNYYKRKSRVKAFSLKMPYIVGSRASNKLLTRLKEDNYPILLEGIHCTYHLFKNELKSRKVFVRLHNVEFEYYNHLARAESSLFKKIYFLFESYLLRKYEKTLCTKATFLAVSLKDQLSYRTLGCSKIHYLPVFVPFTETSSKMGKDDFCLYHGNLSVSENEKAVHWLIKRVFNDLDTQLIIAGKDPDDNLMELIKDSPNVTLIANPSADNMQQLINTAQINVLPSFNSTGIKIKLINALFNGRHCLVNTDCIRDTQLDLLCHIADDANTFKKNIKGLILEELTSSDIEQRKVVLLSMFNNEANAAQLIKLIY
jgi:hypothetical protein